LRLPLGTVSRVFRARRALLLENLALRQQLAALRRRPRGPHALRTWEGTPSAGLGHLISHARLGGLHHRYDRAA
jgi:hypothetical protein